MTTLLTLKQVIERTTLSKATIYRLIKKGVFPEGKKLSKQAINKMNALGLNYTIQ